MSDSLWPHVIVHGILQARILEWIAVPFSRRSFQPRSPALQVVSLPADPPGKPKNTGVGSLSLIQWIFPTQESNRGLPHCRWILYQLSYQGSHVWEGFKCFPIDRDNSLTIKCHWQDTSATVMEWEECGGCSHKGRVWNTQMGPSHKTNRLDARVQA